jgi:hypothetical protein
MPRTKPATTPNDDGADPGQPLRSRINAGSQPPPATTGASSVFELGRKAKPVPSSRSMIDVDAVAIKRGVPVPPPQVGKGAASPYAKLLERMKPGDMVELPYRQGYGLLSMAKKMKVTVTRRTLTVGMLSIWRT